MSEDKNIIKVDFIDGELVIKEGDLIVKQDSNRYDVNKPLYYALDENKNPYPIDLNSISMNRDNRSVKQESYLGFYISTVFLVIDHEFDSSNNKPLLFETMIFKDSWGDDIYQERCSTWDEALTQHEEAKKWLEIYVKRNDKNENNRRKRLVAKPERDA